MLDLSEEGASRRYLVADVGERCSPESWSGRSPTHGVVLFATARRQEVMLSSFFTHQAYLPFSRPALPRPRPLLRRPRHLPLHLPPPCCYSIALSSLAYPISNIHIVCTNTHTHTQTHTHTLYIYTHIHIHINIHTYIYTYIHTYTDTQLAPAIIALVLRSLGGRGGQSVLCLSSWLHHTYLFLALLYVTVGVETGQDFAQH